MPEDTTFVQKRKIKKEKKAQTAKGILGELSKNK